MVTKQIHSLLSEIEKTRVADPLAILDHPLVFEIEKLWAALEIENPKLFALSRVFKNGWSLKKVSDLNIAFERALNKGVVETDFLVTSLDSKTMTKRFPLEIALVNIRSAFNVGGFIRTAEAFGVSKIHLLGYTATPDDPAVKKTAMGIENEITIETWKIQTDFFQTHQEQGYHIVALETSEKAQSVNAPWPGQKTILVFGNERFGLDLEVMKSCDEIREIALFGHKNSLNVVVSAGVVIHEWIRQFEGKL